MPHPLSDMDVPAMRAGHPASSDRRESIVEAALRLAVEEGLHNVTTAAVSREAGIAAGTLFNYFNTKEALLNALYVDLVRRRFAAVTAGLDEAASDKFRTFWFAWARWHLDRPDIPHVIQQYEVSALLTPESRAVREELDEALRRLFIPDAVERPMPPLDQQVMYALMVGPILILTQLRDKGETLVTDELLEATYRRVRRALEG